MPFYNPLEKICFPVIFNTDAALKVYPSEKAAFEKNGLLFPFFIVKTAEMTAFKACFS